VARKVKGGRKVARAGCYGIGAAMGKRRTGKQSGDQSAAHGLGDVRPARGDASAAAEEPGSAVSGRRPFRIPWRGLIIACIGIAMVPAVLGILYRIEAIRPVSTLMLGRWLLLQPVERRWVEIENVAPVVLNSIIMSEDGQFCSHHGVDLRELNAVIDDAMEGEKTRGASTITMQLAKNLFLWNGRSFIRKAAELPLAVYLDIVLPKKRIMEIYVNIAEWDAGVFGIEAAAQHHFGRPAAKLNARQAALLAVTLPAPGVRNPGQPGKGLQRLAGIIERRAARSGGYTACVK
jgi:monofunctional biosynthetic peptidoglycan transglycosylase